MSKLKYTIVQHGGAIDMSGETPIHFILYVSKNQIHLREILKFRNLLRRSNIPSNSTIKFICNNNLSTQIFNKKIFRDDVIKKNNWTISDNEIKLKKNKGTCPLHFYKLIELFKKKYIKYNLIFKSDDHFKSFLIKIYLNVFQ